MTAKFGVLRVASVLDKLSSRDFYSDADTSSYFLFCSSFAIYWCYTHSPSYMYMVEHNVAQHAPRTPPTIVFLDEFLTADLPKGLQPPTYQL